MQDEIQSQWYGTHDGDPRAFALMQRHYTFRAYADGRRANPHNRNRHLFVGPGEKMVLLTPSGDALFIWRKFKDDSGQQGVNCAAFRNESELLSSDLITEAMQLAWARWPSQRLYTYIDPKRIRSTNPGYCFLAAGWRKCGTTKSGKLILEALPE